MRSLPLLVLLLLIAAPLLVHSGTIRHRREDKSTEDCAVSCSGSAGQYEKGKTYTFNWDTVTKIELGFDKAGTTVTHKAKAHVTYHKDCEFSLKLSAVFLDGAEVASDHAATLEKNVLRFGFEFGRVNSVCPSKDDPAWAVNIKRGFLSSFQTGFDDSEEIETDVSGDCHTEYSREGSSLTKKKNLAACQNAHHLHGVRNTHYSVHTKAQNVPLIKSNQDCKIELKDNRLFKSVCSEKHSVPQPFAEGTALESTVTQTVTFADAKDGASDLGAFGKRSNLRFDHSELEHDTRKNAHEGAKKNVEYLCPKAKSLLVKTESGARFVALINDLRQLSKADIDAAQSDCKAFRDAIALCGTEACMEVLVDVIKAAKPKEKAEIFQSVGLIQKPSFGTLNKLAGIADQASAQGLLGLSSLVHTYCVSDVDCDVVDGVKKIMGAIQKKVPAGCSVSVTGNTEALTAIKALGNAVVDVGSVELLNKCIENEKNPLVARVVAAEALHRKPCSAARNSVVEKVLFDEGEDVELRITAFRQLMECASEETLGKVVTQLKDERINQVGSYIWSYLNTKRSSSNPAFADLKAFLRRQTLPPKFNKDPRKFSRYTELGYHNQKANVGAHLDTSVVFVPENYIPRQLSANATIHLFGTSINIFEVESRLEGFDRPADQLFGPDGFFTNAGGFEFDKETYKHSSSKVAAMKDAFLKKIKFDEGRVAASLNLKIFGDDVYYNSYTNSKFVDEVVKNYTMEKGLQAMAELNSVDYEKNYLIVEAVHSVPTVSGFPLRFTLDAALAMKLKTSNKMDVTSLLKGKGEFETQLSSSPSGNLFVTASITLQTSKVRQGVRFESTVHTASSFIVKNSLKDGKFKSVVEMPEEKVELLHTKSDILKIINSVEKSVATGKGDEKTHCTGEAHPFVPVIMGFKGCVQLKKNLPMVEATVYIEKTDAKLKTYEVEIGGKKTADSLNVHMGFDTPGSKVSRKCGAKFDFSAADKKLNFNLELPMRKVNVDGKLDERKKLEDYGAKVNLTISDGNGKLLEEYDLSGDLKIENPEKETYSYSLNAKAVNNSKTAADLKTLVVYNLAKPYFKIDFNLAEALAKPIKLLSEFGVQNKKVTAKVDYAGLHSTSKLNVDGQFNGIQDLSGKLNGEYDFGKPGKVDLEVAHKFDHKNADHKLTQTLKASTTLLGDFEYQWSSEKKSDDVDASVTVNHGKSKNSLVVSSKKQPNGAFNIVATAKSDCLKLDHNLKAEYLLKVPVEFKLKVDFDGTHVKGVSGLLTHKLTTEPMIKLDGEMLLKYPGREISVKNNIAEQKKGRFNAKTVAQWAPKEKIELDSNIVFRPKDIEYSLETTATVNENAAEKIYIKKSYTKEKELRKVNLIAKIADKTIMEISGSVDGQFKQKQEITFAFKKDKLDQKAGAEVVNAFLEQKIDCTATATVEPSSDDLKISGQIKRDSKEFAKGSMALPSSYKNAKQLYKGDFTWDMDKTARTGVLEYKLEKNGDDHKHTMMVNADKTYKFDFDYERKKEDFTVKTKLEKGGKTISSADLKLAAPSWANFELDGKIVSDDPLPRRDINTRASLKLEDKKVDFEGRIDSNGERYMAKGDWTKDEHKNKEKQNEDYRHYKYKFDLEGGSQKINLNQQMKIKDVFTVTKVLTEFAAKVANYNYNVESDYESGKEDVRGKYKVTYNDKKYLTDFKYSYKDGRRQFTETSDYNGKKMTIELDSVYRDKEVAVNAEVKLPDNYGFGTSKFGCKKESYWNCNILGNINDKYTLGGSNAISDEHVKMDYKIRAAELVKNDGKLHVTMKKAESKYVVAAQMSHFERQYGLDVNVDQAKGEVKLKTPEKEYGSGSITVTKIKDGEYQLKTAMDGNSNMNVQCKIVDQDKDKQFDIKITDIEKPFQLKTMHKVANNEQKSAFELILEPDTTKSTYGIGIDLEDDQTKFRAFTLTAKHPKRQVQLKAERPEQTKYKLSLQPDLTGSRAPTVYEVDYDHNDKPDVKSVKFHGKVTDPALKNPIEVKFDANINVGSDHTSYTGESVFEFDYSGEADKKFRWSSKIDRSVAVKRFRRSVDQKHVFVWETKTEHKASGLHLRLFFHNDRVDHDGNLVPSRSTSALGP
ncbi:hypothetical protein L596_006543 [Steinernema carpocapsae]|uniref:Vitellogenin domain-containing protein n=1 Tax=Steinernema carpocapsae TaxID=34508 RepID=A0A4U8V2M5_STECR|nr:hypothetical protein L596_006543 [Steinernema carpocapsae]